MPQGIFNPWDWSADGARILHNCPPPRQRRRRCVRHRATPRPPPRPGPSSPIRITRSGRAAFHPTAAGSSSTRRAESRRASRCSASCPRPAANGRRSPTPGCGRTKPRWSPTAERSTSSPTGTAPSSTSGVIRFDPDSGRAIGEDVNNWITHDPGARHPLGPYQIVAPARQRRHGRGLSRRRQPAGAQRRHQGPARRGLDGPGSPRPVRARGARHRRAEPPAHLRRSTTSGIRTAWTSS